MKNNKILPSNSSVYLIDKYKGVNVDDQNDLKFLKIAFNMKRKK